MTIRTFALFAFSHLVISFAWRANAASLTETTDFATIYNQFRVSQADPLPWPAIYWPFDGRGTGAGINHLPPGQDKSPAEKYDNFFQTGGTAAKWEEQNHNCDTRDESLKAECRAWYGHCNGWTGAALNNPEPDYNTPVTVTNPDTGVTELFNYMDLKALLTESWLDVWASFEGTGSTVKAGAWIFDPNDPVSKAPAANNPGVTNYDAYWDVTPRAFFYAFTTTIGKHKQGLAMDRFTGSQIWNQPVAAYRILPITGNADTPITQNGLQVYPVKIGMKVYWANDSVGYDFKRVSSLNWNINDPKFSTDSVPYDPAASWQQDRSDDGAYLSRYLEFTLFFDAPVKMSDDHTQVVSAGNIVGDGIWAHADKAVSWTWYMLGYETSQTHPDFIWRPDSLADANYRNPNIDPAKIYKYILNKPVPDPSAVFH